MRAHFVTGLLAGAIFLSACATSVVAQQLISCVPRDDALAHLAQKYREAPVAAGVTNKGGLVEVLTTGDGSTWTIILSLPNGVSCLVASGEDWRALPRTDTRIDPRAPGI